MFSDSKTKQFETEEKIWEGKGIVENLFHLLWTKDPIFGTIPSLSIPDTIIFQYDEPIFWYFMDENRIKKKNKSKLTNKHIEESFLKRVPQSGVVAEYFYKVKSEGSDETKVIFEYFNVEEFKNFISNKNKPNSGNGILQRFLQPKGDYNFIIKTTWGPNLCLFEKKECKKKIDQLRYDLYERIFTYEAEDYHSKTVPLRGYILPNKIEKMSYIIVQHVSNVSFERLQIERMVLNFKVDPNDKIWLLYCSFLQLKNTSPFYSLTQILNKIIYDFDVEERVPKHINTEIISILKPLSLHKSFFCYNCNQNIDPSRILEISYKTIIESYELDHSKRSKKLLDEENKKRVLNLSLPNQTNENHKLNYFSKNILIPPMIKRIINKIKEKDYIILKKEPSFLRKKTTVCEDCFLIIVKGNEAGGYIDTQNSNTPQNINLYGTGRLRPEVTIYREKITQRNIIYKRLVEDLRPDINSKIINDLISPSRFFTFEKFGKQKNGIKQIDRQSLIPPNFKQNLIEIPIRGSIRGSIRKSFFNPSSIEKQEIATTPTLFVKKDLENVNEDGPEMKESENNSSIGELDDDGTNSSKRNSKNEDYSLKESNCENKIPFIKQKTIDNEIKFIQKENIYNKTDINEQNNLFNYEKDIEEKESLNSENETDQSPKNGDSLKKIFIPRLQKSVNSVCRLFVPTKLSVHNPILNLIKEKNKSPKITITINNTQENESNLNLKNKKFNDSNKTTNFHSRNSSLPTLLMSSTNQIETHSKNNFSFFDKHNKKAIYLEKLQQSNLGSFTTRNKNLSNFDFTNTESTEFHSKSKIKNIGLKKLQETLGEKLGKKYIR